MRDSLFLPAFFLLLSFLFLWPSRPRNPKWFRSNVISACCFSAGYCHGTVPSDLLCPSVLKKTRIPTERPPLTFFQRLLGFLLAGLLVFLSHQRCCSPSYIASSSERSTRCYCDRREISFLLLLPSLSSLEERLGCLLKARISLHFSSTCYFSPPSFGRFHVHWSLFSRCLLTGNHWLCLWLPTFWTTFTRWSGWTSLLAGEELLIGSECWLACFRLLFHLVSQSPRLVKLPCALQSTGLH